MQRVLIGLGLALLLLGVLWPWLGRLPFGRLPGDILIEREGSRFYFPITTCIVVSLMVSLVAWLARIFRT